MAPTVVTVLVTGQAYAEDRLYRHRRTSVADAVIDTGDDTTNLYALDEHVSL